MVTQSRSHGTLGAALNNAIRTFEPLKSHCTDYDIVVGIAIKGLAINRPTVSPSELLP